MTFLSALVGLFPYALVACCALVLWATRDWSQM
jgi:hypothetical protein